MKDHLGAGTREQGLSRADAMRALHDDYAAVLTRFVAGLTHEGTVAEDVVAETLLRAWKHPEVLQRPEAGLRAWLFTVARNLVIDDWRSAHHRWERPSAELPDHVAPDPAERILDSWLVAEAMATLTPEHRGVITRAYFGGEDTETIAGALGIPAGTVKSRLHYGLRALRLALEENGVSRP
ncbi:sigma-70 family RNA polymerase sigma factor [Arthrobacter sp. GMC3]|uniref:sigma-70 family RNA polymerase sigma factor n=1 Tax=Arthrobacter sp. GMC3 TaxID=2058894 RepID=UPI0021576D48|nr:sigma-70 family RNA polymerase sigma factor [Arthrobacter sp. GMC3]